MLAAGFAAGVPGMILGIPGYTVLRVLAREFFNNFKAVRKLTSGLDTVVGKDEAPGISESVKLQYKIKKPDEPENSG